MIDTMPLASILRNREHRRLIVHNVRVYGPIRILFHAVVRDIPRIARLEILVGDE